MPWRIDSTAGAHIWDTQPMSDDDLKLRDEELKWLMVHEGRRWKVINGRIAQKGDPVMNRGNFSGPGAYANSQALTAVTGGAINVAWWAPGTYSPIPAQSVQAPMAFRLWASGIVTSSGAGQTLTMNPAVGTAVAGQALGASAALALGSTITGAFWRLEYGLLIQKPGTAGTAVGSGEITWGTTAGATPGTPTATNPSNALFSAGNTAATVDWVTTAQGLLIAATPSAAGVSVTPNIVVFQSLD